MLLADIVVTPVLDLEEYVTSAVTSLGVVISAVVLAWFGFLVIRIGVRWLMDVDSPRGPRMPYGGRYPQAINTSGGKGIYWEGGAVGWDARGNEVKMGAAARRRGYGEF